MGCTFTLLQRVSYGDEKQVGMAKTGHGMYVYTFTACEL